MRLHSALTVVVALLLTHWGVSGRTDLVNPPSRRFERKLINLAMAKYLPGPQVGQISGSQGNTTYGHGRGGSWFRNRTIPTNPNTPSQTAQRVLFTEFTQTWRSLSAGAQQGWRDLALIDPTTDTLGQEIVLSGNAYYVGFNMDRAQVGLARLDVAPALVEVPPAVSSAIVAPSGGGATIDYTPTVVGGSATNFQLIYASAPKSAGVNVLGRSDVRVITAIAGNAPAVPPEDLGPAYEAVFGVAWETAVGMNIGFRFDGVSDSGFKGDFLQQIVAIAA